MHRDPVHDQCHTGRLGGSGKLCEHHDADDDRRGGQECHRITGEDCFLLRVHLRSIEELEEVLDRFAPFGQTTTSIIRSTPVPFRPLSPTG